MTLPKISIVIPVYNVEKYLFTCLTSVVNQTLKDLEILCIEDCSSDASLQVLENFQKNDQRVRIIKNEKNSGLSTSRNIGIQHASAPYIMFLDSDDCYHPDMCQKMFEAITSNHSDVAICSVEMLYEAYSENKDVDEQYFKNPFDGTHLLTPGVISKITNVVAWNKIYKTHLIKSYKIKFPDGLIYESYPFWGAYCAVASRVTFLSDKLYKYRRHDGGIMAATFAKKRNSIDYVKSVITLYEWLEENKLWDRFQWNFSRLFLFCVRAAKNYAPDQEYMNEIDKLVSSFLSHINYSKNFVGSNTYRILKLYEKNAYAKEISVWPGLKISKDLSTERVTFLGINIFKKKFGSSVKSYFLGIPVLKSQEKQDYAVYKLFGIFPIFYQFHTKTAKQQKLCEWFCCYIPGKRRRKKYVAKLGGVLFGKTVDVSLDDANFSPFRINDDILLQELRKLGTFTYIPNPGNLGDCLIARGTYDFFEKNNLIFEEYAGQPVTNIVYGGGGIWFKDIYANGYRKYLDIMKQAKKVVILPSSVCDCVDLVSILDERFVVFCRDKRSYEYLLSQKTKATIYLSHDMALRLSKNGLKGKIEISAARYSLLRRMWNKLSRIGKVAYFFRNDKEKDIDLPSHYDLSLAFGSRVMSRADVDFAAMLMLSVVDMYDVIVTDRLHVGIAATLMNKEVYLFDNNYGKLSGVYENSLKDRDNVHLCNTLPNSYPVRDTATNNFLRLLKDQ